MLHKVFVIIFVSILYQNTSAIYFEQQDKQFPLKRDNGFPLLLVIVDFISFGFSTKESYTIMLCPPWVGSRVLRY